VAEEGDTVGEGVDCNKTTPSAFDTDLVGVILLEVVVVVVVDSFVLPETRFGRATYAKDIFIIDLEKFV
jgi:hypothetical protein